MTKYAVTGATGKLGRLVLDELLLQANPRDSVALARDPSALANYAQKGIDVRRADYDDPDGLKAALNGVDRVLLISGNAVGQRHQDVKGVARQRQEGVGRIIGGRGTSRRHGRGLYHKML